MVVRRKFISFLSAFTLLFYLSKFFGIISYSTLKFHKYKILQPSKLGILWSIASLIYHSAQYHYISVTLSLSDNYEETRQSSLTTAIGICLNYIGPLMMTIDIIFGLLNQGRINLAFKQIKTIDNQLENEGIIIDNTKLKNRTFILIVTIVICELINFILSFMTFYDPKKYISWLSFASCTPFLINGFEKIWFSSFIFAIQQRFEAINQYLDEKATDFMEEITRKHIICQPDKKLDSMESYISDENLDINLGYLHKDIGFKNTFRIVFNHTKNISKIIPVLSKTEVNEAKKTSFYKDELKSSKTLEIKLNTMCQLHDEICELGKAINKMWGIQLLLLLAFGFISITAQFYFLYCTIVGENVPGLFRSATRIHIVGFSVSFAAAKCVYIIYLSWKTNLEARRTGICLHRCGVTINENSFYKIVNHLSLKLLSHSVNFTACGFFNLDMSTLYAVTGAITSYLIILIQFNLAAHHTRKETEISSLTTILPSSRPES